MAFDLAGAIVLDCFAGAGGLGLEAASRGATRVTLVEVDRKVAVNLSKQSQRLQADNISIESADILNFLDESTESYDLVFIDPPYAESDLRVKTLNKLIDGRHLNQGCKIYLEWPVNEQFDLTHPELIWVKQKTAAQVVYAIAQWSVTR